MAEGGQAVFTKYLLLGEARTRFEFAPEKMKAVYEKLRRMDFLAYPTAFTTPPITTPDRGMEGSSGAGTIDVVTVSDAGLAHSVQWTYDSGLLARPRDPATVAMRELEGEILKLLEAKPEYKALPPTTRPFH